MCLILCLYGWKFVTNVNIPSTLGWPISYVCWAMPRGLIGDWLGLFIGVQVWGVNGNGWHNQVICRWYSLIYDVSNKLKSFLSNNNFGSKSRFHSLSISSHNIDYVSWTHVWYDSLGGKYWCSVVCVCIFKCNWGWTYKPYFVWNTRISYYKSMSIIFQSYSHKSSCWFSLQFYVTLW